MLETASRPLRNVGRTYRGQPVTSLCLMVIAERMSQAEVEDMVAGQKGRGFGLWGVLAPYTGSDDIVVSYRWLRHQWDSTNARHRRQHVRIVCIVPDPDAELADPAAVTFTPEDAISVVKRQDGGVWPLTAVGQITDIRAALMTLSEVDALVHYGIPPRPPGTVPGALVILVVVKGTSEVQGSQGISISTSVAYAVFDTRTGHAFRMGTANHDIILP